MNTIQLIPADFTDVNSAAATEKQFTSPWNCPIYKACKRLGMDVESVGTGNISLNTEKDIRIEGMHTDIERCRQELVAGAPFAEIEIIK